MKKALEKVTVKDEDVKEYYEKNKEMFVEGEAVGASHILVDSEEKAKEFFKSLYELRDENFGNGRDVRNYFENVIAAHSDRVSQLEAPTKDDLMTILPEDLEKAETLES